MATKADKLISRGSETPGVADAAAHVSDMLIRMMLNQPQYFAEAVERALPKLTREEAVHLRSFFCDVADYFGQKAVGEDFPQLNRHNESVVRNWQMGGGEYNLLRVFAVLSCPFENCADRMGCWETRRGFCAMDAK